MIDEHGIKRDTRPNASDEFCITLQRCLDKVMRYAELAARANEHVVFHYTEHRSSRGIKLLTMTEAKGGQGPAA